jgi:hypothetical protein
VIAALVVACLVAGIAYVVGDIREPVIRQPAYAREYTQRGRLGPVVVAALAWMLFAVSRRRWGVILIFVIVAAAVGAVARSA